MVRAVVKDRRGDVVSDVRNFQSQADLEHYAMSVSVELSRRGQRVAVLPPSPLTEEQQAQLSHLTQFARQANGLMKHFVMDGDMHRRIKNMVPTAQDIHAFWEAIVQAADQFKELLHAEFGLDDEKKVA
jgi:hypothetical protein